jgi:hypothetical protein
MTDAMRAETIILTGHGGDRIEPISRARCGAVPTVAW